MPKAKAKAKKKETFNVLKRQIRCVRGPEPKEIRFVLTLTGGGGADVVVRHGREGNAVTKGTAINVKKEWTPRNWKTMTCARPVPGGVGKGLSRQNKNVSSVTAIAKILHERPAYFNGLAANERTRDCLGRRHQVSRVSWRSLPAVQCGVGWWLMPPNTNPLKCAPFLE